MCKRVWNAVLCVLVLFNVFPVGAMANSVPIPASDDAVEAAEILSGLESDADFGGVYLTENASKVVVLLVKATQARKNEIRAMVIPAGGLGGFFAPRNSAIYQDGTRRVEPDANTPDTPKALAKQSFAIVRGIVKSAPTGTKEGAYTLELRESIRGNLKDTITVTAMPRVMEKGKSYIVFLKEQASGGKKTLVLTDSVYFSAFELNDRVYVLPIREYGMTKPVTQTAFIKGL